MPKRVLVLDFDHQTRKSTVSMLQARGIDVVEAGSMDEFTRALIPGAPDVALVEPELHGADSSELCSLIHGSSIGSPSIILASHSLGQDALRYRASQVGAKLYFERPVADERLVSAIKDAIEKADAGTARRPPKVAPAKMPGSHPPAAAVRETAAAPREVELTKIGSSDFEGWLDDVFSGIEGEEPEATAAPVSKEVDLDAPSETLDFGELIANKPRPASTRAPAPPAPSPTPVAAPTPPVPEPAPIATAAAEAGSPPSPNPQTDAPQTAAAVASGNEGDSSVSAFLDPTPSELPAWSPDAAWEGVDSAPPRPSNPQPAVAGPVQLAGAPKPAQAGLTGRADAPVRMTAALGYVPPAPRGNAGLLLSLPIVAAMLVGGFYIWQNYGPSPVAGLPFAPPRKAEPVAPAEPLPAPPATAQNRIAAPTDGAGFSKRPATPAESADPKPAGFEPAFGPPVDPAASTRTGSETSGPRAPVSAAEPKPDANPTPEKVQTRPEPRPEIQRQVQPQRPAMIQQKAQPTPARAQAPTRTPTPTQAPTREPAQSLETRAETQAQTPTTTASEPVRSAAPIERMADPFEFVRKKQLAPEPKEPTLIDGGTASMVPATLIESSRVQPRVTAAARRMETFGTVVMQVQILADGTVGDVHVVSEPNRKLGLGKAAIAAVKQWRYTPATVGGEAAESTTEVRIAFKP